MFGKGLKRLLEKKGSVFSSALLLSGYIIGTGFLAIPAATGPSGFWTGAIAGFLIWLFVLSTGFLFFEALLTQRHGASVVTVCRNLSGPFAAILGSIAFCLINYYFSASIFTVSVSVLEKFFSQQLHLTIDALYLYLGLFVIFFMTTFLGTYVSDRVNFLLFVLLVFSIVGALISGLKNVTWQEHTEKNWYLIFFAVPIFVTSYDFQSLVPTLTAYLDKNPKKITHVLVIGTVIPFMVYTVWQWFALSASTSAEIWEAFESGSSTLSFFARSVKENPLFGNFFHWMTFFAAVTSLIGAGLALLDFFMDAFDIPLEKRGGLKRFWLCSVVFVPSLLSSWALPKLFTIFPSFIVGFAEAFFLGILPIWLVIRLRYVLKIPSHSFLPGGKFTLTILMFITFILIYFEGLQFFRRS